MVLSTALIRLGSLSVSGLAVTFSEVFRNALVSLAVAFVTVCLVFYAVPGYAEVFIPYGTLAKVAPLYSWISTSMYAGQGFATLNFLACIALATGLLLLPLWLFDRKSYQSG